MSLDSLRRSPFVFIPLLFGLGAVTYFPSLQNPLLTGEYFWLFLVNVISLVSFSIVSLFLIVSSRQQLGVAALFAALVIVNPLALPVLFSPHGILVITPLFLMMTSLFLLERVSLKILGAFVALLAPIFVLGHDSFRWGIEIAVIIFGLWIMYYLSGQVFRLKSRLALVISFALVTSCMAWSQYRSFYLQQPDNWIEFQIKGLQLADQKQFWRFYHKSFEQGELSYETINLLTDSILTHNSQEQALLRLGLTLTRIETQDMNTFELRDEHLNVLQKLEELNLEDLSEVRVESLLDLLALMGERIVISSASAFDLEESLIFYTEFYELLSPVLRKKEFEKLYSHFVAIKKIREKYQD